MPQRIGAPPRPLSGACSSSASPAFRALNRRVVGARVAGRASRVGARAHHRRDRPRQRPGGCLGRRDRRPGLPNRRSARSRRPPSVRPRAGGADLRHRTCAHATGRPLAPGQDAAYRRADVVLRRMRVRCGRRAPPPGAPPCRSGSGVAQRVIACSGGGCSICTGGWRRGVVRSA